MPKKYKAPSRRLTPLNGCAAMLVAWAVCYFCGQLGSKPQNTGVNSPNFTPEIAASPRSTTKPSRTPTDEPIEHTKQELDLYSKISAIPGIIYADVPTVDESYIVGMSFTVRPGADTLTLAKKMLTTANAVLSEPTKLLVVDFFTGTKKFKQYLWDGTIWSVDTLTLVDSLYAEKVQTATAAAPQKSVAPTKITPP